MDPIRNDKGGGARVRGGAGNRGRGHVAKGSAGKSGDVGSRDETRRASRAKQYCGAFLQQLTSRVETLKAYLLRKVTIDEDTGCFLWEGRVANSGYPQASCQVGGKQKRVTASRLAYTLWKGPIPKGLVIGHLCHRPLCIRPEHLEAMTQGKNRQQAEDRKRVNAVLDRLRRVPEPKVITVGGAEE